MKELAYYEPALDKLVSNFEYLGEGSPKGRNSAYEAETPFPSIWQKFLSLEKEIVLSDISYHYPNMEESVLTNADMNISVGKSTGIAGVSGAGKTTSVDISWAF